MNISEHSFSRHISILLNGFIHSMLVLCMLPDAVRAESPEVNKLPRMNYMSNGPVPLQFRIPPPKPLPPEKTSDEDPTQTPDEIDISKTPTDQKETDEKDSDQNNSSPLDQEKPTINMDPSDVAEIITSAVSTPKDQLLIEWQKYRNSNILSISDLPEIPDILKSTLPSQSPNIPFSGQPRIDLIRDSYFGKSEVQGIPHPEWQSYAEKILQAMEQLTSSEQNPINANIISRDRPYPFGFLPPGDVWLPANSSVTYSTGQE